MFNVAWLAGQFGIVPVLFPFDNYFSAELSKKVFSLISNSLEARKNEDFIGNIIDWRIQDMSNGQTNGIPQGSVLMDFIAEIVLGHADLQLTQRLESKSITEYRLIDF